MGRKSVGQNPICSKAISCDVCRYGIRAPEHDSRFLGLLVSDERVSILYLVGRNRKKSHNRVVSDTAESVFQNESVSFFRSLYIAYQAGGILGKVDAPYLILSVEYPQNAVVRLVEFVDAPSFVSRRKNDGEVVVVFAEKQLLRGCDAQAMILRLIEAVDAVD